MSTYLEIRQTRTKIAEVKGIVRDLERQGSTRGAELARRNLKALDHRLLELQARSLGITLPRRSRAASEGREGAILK